MKRMRKFLGIAMLVALILLLVTVLSVFLFLSFSPTVGDTPDKSAREHFAKITSLYYDDQFHNERLTTIRSTGTSPKSDRVRPNGILPAVKPDAFERLEPGKLQLTWFGHSSVLYQLGDKMIFIDPVFGDRASPVGFAGPKRFSELPIRLEGIPNLDVVFISHDHYDHLDYNAIRTLDSRVKSYVAPLGIDAYLTGWGVDAAKIHTLNWWESCEIDGVTYTLTPSQHFSGRNPLKMNQTLWGGLHFTDGVHSVYFSGDSGYCDVFAQVYERFGEVDLMTADSGQYNAAWAAIHMTPAQAVQAAKDARAKWFIPVHWGSFVLSNHSWNDPPRIALETAKQHGVNIAMPRIGQTVDYEKIETVNEKWWENYE